MQILRMFKEIKATVRRKETQDITHVHRMMRIGENRLHLRRKAKALSLRHIEIATAIRAATPHREIRLVQPLASRQFIHSQPNLTAITQLLEQSQLKTSVQEVDIDESVEVLL